MSAGPEPRNKKRTTEGEQYRCSHRDTNRECGRISENINQPHGLREEEGIELNKEGEKRMTAEEVDA